MIQIGAPTPAIDDPVEHLMACHRRIEQRLDALNAASDHLDHKPAEALAAIARSLHFLDTSGVLHTQDEERSLFPRLRARLSLDEIAYLDSLEAQHAEAEALLARLKQLVEEGAPAASYRQCAEELRRLYRAHIQSEDEVLAKLTRRNLGASELAEIAHEMRDRRAPGETPA